jgi:hypothetical protein
MSSKIIGARAEGKGRSDTERTNMSASPRLDDLPPHLEQTIHFAFVALHADLYGPAGASATEGAWERFRDHVLLSITTSAREKTCDPGEWADLVLAELQIWLCTMHRKGARSAERDRASPAQV